MDGKFDDAMSIVGEDHAKALAERDKLQVRSHDGKGVAPGAIVIKAKDAEAQDLGGAKSLDEAEAFLTRSADDAPVLLDAWEVLAVVAGNIAGDPKKALAIRTALAEFQETLDVQTAKAILNVEKVLGGNTMTKELVKKQVPPQFLDEEKEEPKDRRPDKDEGEAELEDEVKDKEEDKDEEEDEEEMEYKSHPLDAEYSKLRQTIDAAMASAGTEAEKLAMVQESLNGMAAEIKTQISSSVPQGAVDVDAITRSVTDAVASQVREMIAPLTASVAALETRNLADAPASAASHVPAPRGLTPGPGQSAIIRSDPAPKKESETPKLSALVRKSVYGQ